MRIALIFKSYGPYHLARLRALGQRHDVLPLEFAACDSVYDWRADEQKREMRVRTFSDARAGLTFRLNALHTEFQRFRPDAVAIPGYSESDALAVACLCRRLAIPSVLMSDTHDASTTRSVVRTALKRRLLTLFDAALVAGTPHADYLERLGFDRRRITLGYDVVDNRHFTPAFESAINCEGDATLSRAARFFFCCCRLVEKKNIGCLIDAFADYREQTPKDAWDLVIAGDGPLREDLLRRIAERNISRSVRMVGAQTYDDLPRLYGHAGAFVLPSLREEWGLVVNEAMAAGLPVLVSTAAGCHRDLVRDGLNGYTFEPSDRARLTLLLQTIAHASVPERSRMGDASRRIIRRWTLDRFVAGMSEAVSIARDDRKPARVLAAKAIAQALSYRKSA